VTASTAGIPTSATFNLSNTGVSSGSSLTGTVNSSTSAVNLTAEGPNDWIHWERNGAANRKASGGAQFGGTALGSGTVLGYVDDQRPINWSDGAPTASSSNNTDGIYVAGVGNGFMITAPADTTPRTLVVHVGGWNSSATLTAHLSDGSAVDYVDTTAPFGDQYNRNYTLSYKASSPNQTLSVTWRMTTGPSFGNVTLSAAALNIGP